MAITTRRLTVDDLDAIPEEHPGDRHELIDGELVVTPVPIIKHQIASGNVSYAISHHARDRKLGWVFHPQTGIRMSDDTLLIPDLIFVSRERSGILGEKTMDGPPDLVVEVLSPGTRRRDLGIKRELYARFGVREYWIVDPERETVTVFVLAGDAYELLPPTEEGMVPSRVLPELRLSVNAVFTLD